MRRLACVLLLLLVAAPARADVAVRSSVSATRIPLGESFEWVVSVDGAMGAEAPVVPQIDFARIESQGSSQQMSFVNGVMSQRTVFQFRLTPTRTGNFQVPAVTVRAKGGVYSTDPIALEVTPPQPGVEPSLAANGRVRLRLVASAAPRSVVVGEPVVYTIRFYQGTRILGSPDYRGPETPRFYVEPTGPGTTAYEGSGPDRWLVGERRTVLYPTVTGRLTIGPATMACLVADYGNPDGVEVDLQSQPVPIDVHSLPPAPAGFSGTVADARLTGALDRTSVRADEAVTLTFRLAGRGNLRLAAPPSFDRLADFEIFDRKIEDSLAVEEGNPEGTKLVRYTLLPRRPGALELPPLRYVVYVPGDGYRTLEWAGARVDVAPGLGRGRAAGASRFTLVPTAAPGGTPWTAARPWAGAALVLLALAFALPRLVPRPAAPGGPEGAARAAELDQALEALGQARTRGDVREFWRRAESALALLPAGAAEDLRARIAQARYAPGGGSAAEVDAAFARLHELLKAERTEARASARVRAPLWVRASTIALLVFGVAAAGIGAFEWIRAPKDDALASRLRLAAGALQGETRPQARAALLELWNEGARRPGVALDLAIAAWYDRRLGETTLWTERARRLDPRHPLVRDLERALAQEGAWEGLPTGARARTTGGELAFAACAAAALGVLLLGLRRRWTRIAGGLALLIGIVVGVIAAQSGAAGEAPGRGILLAETLLADRPGGSGDVTLEAGRAVWLEGASGGWMRVRAGSQVRGFVPVGQVRAI